MDENQTETINVDQVTWEAVNLIMERHPDDMTEEQLMHEIVTSYLEMVRDRMQWGGNVKHIQEMSDLLKRMQ